MALLEPTEPSSNWKKLQTKLQHEKAKESSLRGVKRKLSPLGHKASTSKRPKPGTKEVSSNKRKSDNMNRSSQSVVRPRSKSQPAKKHVDAQNESHESRPSTSHGAPAIIPPAEVNEGVSDTTIPGRYIALDCEMVGTGPDPERGSQLARVSIVNFHGMQVYDSYVLPRLPVTDYRTAVSGIRPHHLRPTHARSFKEVRSDVQVFLKGRVLVGHAIKKDLNMLMLNHPANDIRDTSRHPPFRERVMGRTPSLKRLAKELLGLNIQTGEHSSVEDARVAMLLYKQEKDIFEAQHRPPRKNLQTTDIGGNIDKTVAAKAKRHKKKRKGK